MSTFDVTLGRHNVLLTTTQAKAAERIGAAIAAEAEHLFQCEGLKVDVVQTDRDGSSTEAEPGKPKRKRAKRRTPDALDGI